jgi:hypothetical protein
VSRRSGRVGGVAMKMYIQLFIGAVIIGVLTAALGYPAISNSCINYNNVIIIIGFEILWCLLTGAAKEDYKMIYDFIVWFCSKVRETFCIHDYQIVIMTRCCTKCGRIKNEKNKN